MEYSAIISEVFGDELGQNRARVTDEARKCLNIVPEYVDRIFDKPISIEDIYEQDPLTSDKPLMLYYEKNYVGVLGMLADEVRHHRYRLKAMMTLESFGKRTSSLSRGDMKVIDYGAGTGYIGVPLAMAGYDVTCFDCGYAKYVLESRKKKWNLDFELADVWYDPLPRDESVDAIVCYEVLEHVYDPLSLVAKFNRALKHGGLLYLTWSFGRGGVSQHLEANYQYHGKLQEYIEPLGFSQPLEREGLETEFPVWIFRKIYKV